MTSANTPSATEPLEMLLRRRLAGRAHVRDLRVVVLKRSLVLDDVRANSTLFLRSDEVAAAWAFADPMWASPGGTPEKPAEGGRPLR